VRVLDCGGNGTDARTIAGVDWVTNNSVHPAVANMSLDSGSSYTLDVAVRNSIASGVTYVVSAGNENTDVVYKSPANVMEAITVAASDQNDARVTDSNYGTLVDLFAPGANITSNAIGGSITNGSGTSAAAPFVAGTVAMYLQANPGASPATVGNAISAAATKNVITNPGAGSPNALLYANFPSATVTIAGQESYECRIQTPTVECGGGLIFDSGFVTVTVNGHNYTTSYGQGSTRTSIASALAASIQSDPAVTAWSSGSVITVVSRAFSCFTIGTDYNTSQPSRFNPSFTATASTPGPGCP
jgi:hypothetical protein